MKKALPLNEMCTLMGKYMTFILNLYSVINTVN